MIGYQQPNNDFYIFLKDSEIKELEEKILEGVIINLNDSSNRAKLTLDIDNNIRDLASFSIKRDEKRKIISAEAHIHKNIYEQLKTSGDAEPHLGWCHVCLRNTKNLSINDSTNYSIIEEFNI